MKNDYLVTKRPVVALAVFFLPIMLGNLFQQLYNLVDAAIVGQFVNEKAVAAVGACLAFTNVFIFIANGGGIGGAVIVGRGKRLCKNESCRQYYVHFVFHS